MDYVLKIMPPLIEGTGVTLQVFLITLLLSVPLGLGLALARISRFKSVSVAVTVVHLLRAAVRPGHRNPAA